MSTDNNSLQNSANAISIGDPDINKYDDRLQNLLVALEVKQPLAADLMQELKWDASSCFSVKPENISLRVWLVKMLIRKYVVRISIDHFEARTYSPEGKTPDLCYPNSCNLPLDKWIIRTLWKQFFTELEITEILNTSIAKVRLILKEPEVRQPLL